MFVKLNFSNKIYVISGYQKEIYLISMRGSCGMNCQWVRSPNLLEEQMYVYPLLHRSVLLIFANFNGFSCMCMCKFGAENC